MEVALSGVGLILLRLVAIGGHYGLVEIVLTLWRKMKVLEGQTRKRP